METTCQYRRLPCDNFSRHRKHKKETFISNQFATLLALVNNVDQMLVNLVSERSF